MKLLNKSKNVESKDIETDSLIAKKQIYRKIDR